MAESHAHGLTDEALEALVHLFTRAVRALADCEGAVATCLPEERAVPLRFTEVFRNHSGQIAAILAANGKAVDMVGTWISARNKLVAELRELRASHATDMTDLMHRISAPMADAYAAALSHSLPQATFHDVRAMRDALAERLDALRRG